MKAKWRTPFALIIIASVVWTLVAWEGQRLRRARAKAKPLMELVDPVRFNLEAGWYIYTLQTPDAGVTVVAYCPERFSATALSDAGSLYRLECK